MSGGHTEEALSRKEGEALGVRVTHTVRDQAAGATLGVWVRTGLRACVMGRVLTWAQGTRGFPFVSVPLAASLMECAFACEQDAPVRLNTWPVMRG